MYKLLKNKNKLNSNLLKHKKTNIVMQSNKLKIIKTNSPNKVKRRKEDINKI
jgi:hypothetical protein